MYTPPNAAARAAYPGTGYALGITVNQRNGAQHFQHGGGGFGFNASMVWYPELKLGSVVLTNFPQPDGYCVHLSEDVLDSIIASDIPLYRQRYISATRIDPAYPSDGKGEILSEATLRDLIAGKALPEDAAARQRRSEAVGTYIVTSWGFPIETIEIAEKDGKLTWTYTGDMEISPSTTLTEVQPGLFFSTAGNLLDLREPVRLLDNVRLVKADPQVRVVQTVLYGLFGLVFLITLFFWPARAFRRKNVANEPAVRAPASRWQVGAGILATLASFLGLICLAFIALVPNLMYLPWPLPFVDLAWWQFALVGLPFANLALAVGAVLAAALALYSGKARGAGWYFLAVGLALLAFEALILL
jgi:hypothetical protein